MKKIVSLIAILLIAPSLHARDLRTPQMPRGLTADKSSTPINVVTNKPKKSTSRKVKRKGLQGYKVHNTFSDMSYDELKVAKNLKLQQKNWDIAGKYLERMIKLCDNVNEKAALVVELADLLFTQEKYDDAAKWFTEFTVLYPGNPQIEYASYKAILCASKEILSIDRDQSATEKALNLSTDFLKRDLFTTYKKEVAAVYQLCQETLAQSDCYVAEYYLKNKSYAAAERRVTNLRSDWIEKVPEIQAPLAVLETALAQEYPQFKAPEQSIVLAQAINPVKKIDMTARF